MLSNWPRIAPSVTGKALDLDLIGSRGDALNLYVSLRCWRTRHNGAQKYHEVRPGCATHTHAYNKCVCLYVLNLFMGIFRSLCVSFPFNSCVGPDSKLGFQALQTKLAIANPDWWNICGPVQLGSTLTRTVNIRASGCGKSPANPGLGHCA